MGALGEQSVGKSYALNHLVDTSFAGSAMRCTEGNHFLHYLPECLATRTKRRFKGVWLSLTPTRDALIVALDFEGKRS